MINLGYIVGLHRQVGDQPGLYSGTSDRWVINLGYIVGLHSQVGDQPGLYSGTSQTGR